VTRWGAVTRFQGTRQAKAIARRQHPTLAPCAAPNCWGSRNTAYKRWHARVDLRGVCTHPPYRKRAFINHSPLTQSGAVTQSGAARLYSIAGCCYLRWLISMRPGAPAGVCAWAGCNQPHHALQQKTEGALNGAIHAADPYHSLLQQERMSKQLSSGASSGRVLSQTVLQKGAGVQR
jgi:hypothetical protein